MASDQALRTAFAVPASLAEAVADHLGKEIAEGRFRPGQRLIETQLCSAFGVSRTPMREALRMLAAEGLVDISSRKGARVADLTVESVSDVFRVRSTLEGLAAELAAREAAPEDIADLAQLNADMHAEVVEGRARGFFDLNSAFHRRIAVVTGNSYLASLQLTTAARSFRPLFMALSQIGHLLDSVRDHESILDAIGKGDPVRAKKRMERHILNAEREALRLLGSLTPSADTSEPR